MNANQSLSLIGDLTMKKPIILSFCFAVVATAATQSSAVELPSADQSPIPQMEIGKIKRVKKDSLPPELKSFMDKEQLKATSGVAEISDQQISAFEDFRRRLQSHDALIGNVKVSLSDVTSTELVNYRYEGLIPEGPSGKAPGRVYREFSRVRMVW